MSRVVEEHKIPQVAIGAVGLVQQFYDDLDTIQIQEAGAGPRDFTSLLPSADISSEKWEITNDWMQTIGPWTGLATAHFRISQTFIKTHPTPWVWASEFLLLKSDPLSLFLRQAEEGRITVGHLNGHRVRKRL
jgi:hypothetical protein